MNDLISRQEAIKIVKRYLLDCHVEDADWHGNGIEYELKNLQPAQQWIPVSERLPETKKAVLVWCPFYKNIFCAYRKKECDGWYIYGAYFTPIEYDVTAWMPLPEPFKEVE